jgi:predicted permease
VRRFLVRLRVSATRRRDEARLREEVQAHLDRQTDENRRAGLTPHDARRQAILAFGAVEAITDQCRDEQRLPLVEDFVQDVRYALRQLRRAPLFTLAATLSLAMGIGANAAVFTVVDRVLMRPLPVADPHELVSVTDDRILTQPHPRFSYPYYRSLRDTSALAGVAARAGVSLNLTETGSPVRVAGELVSGNYFDVLGVSARAGRLLSSADDRTPGAHPVVVVSGAFARRAFAEDTGLVGRALVLNDHAFTIVGIAADGFAGTDIGEPADVWLPLAMQRDVGRNLLADARTNWLEIFGRLRPGTNRDAAARELNRQFQLRAAALNGDAGERSIVLLAGALGSSPLRGELRSALAVLFALTGVALALACVNVASLAAVRSAAREKELTIRLALGARRSRLRRQLLTEGLVLAGLGGVAGLLAAPWVARGLVSMQSTRLEIGASLGPRLLLFGFFVSLVAAAVVALPPVRAVGRIGGRMRRFVVRDGVVALQIAMALSMLVSAALLMQSVRRFRSVDPGFRAEGLVLATLDPGSAGYGSDRIDGFWRDVLVRARRLPGVESVSLARTVPLARTRQRQHWVHPASGEELELDTNRIGPDYFRTLGIPQVSGREFSDEDGRLARPAVVVNQRFAQVFWPGQDAIGRMLRVPESGNRPAEVVGVVRDVKIRDLRGEAGPMIYRPALQGRSTDAMTLHVRAVGDTTALISDLRLTIRDLDAAVPLFAVTTLEEQLDASFGQTRQAAALTGVFGALALLLSGVGVYGVAALAVRRRTREIGIRIALGAGRVQVARAIGSRGAALIAIGVCVGLIGAFGVTQVIGTLLFGVTTADLPTFGWMATLLTAVSLLALAIPLRAATRLDALRSIREE